jgi:tetratricopeptide (TPR) repeat protein
MNRFKPVQVLLSLAVLLAWPFAGTAAKPVPPTRQPAVLLSPAEFPDYDAAVWRDERNGLANKSSSKRLTEQPASPEIGDLLELNRVDDALRVLRSIVDKHPENMSRAFEIVAEHSSQFIDHARGYPDSLQQLVDAARTKLPRLPREEAARAERQLLLVDRQPSLAKRPPFADQLRAFVQQYAGTQTARLTEVDVIAVGLPLRAKLEALDKFVRDHPGTIAAAKALHEKAFQLSSGNVYPDIEARGADPTARFFRVLDIVKELESGRYPPCEWVERAPSLVSTFYAYEPTYAPANIDRQLDAYRAFAKTHFAVADQYPLITGTGYIITTKMFDLLKRKGEGISSLDRVFAEFERDTPDGTAVQYLRAVFYVRSMNSERGGERAALFRKASEGLLRLQGQGHGLYHRKALATLASLYFSEREYAIARTYFRAYVKTYPDTAWAWVAALRVGQTSESLGEEQAGVDAYLAGASRYSSVPLARVLGHAYAARGYEALAQFTTALREYQAALAGWDQDYGQVFSLHIIQDSRANENRLERNRPDVSLSALSQRVAQLKASLSTPGGALLETGRWSVDHGRFREALVPLDQLLSRDRSSAMIAEVRYLAHRARLGLALEMASDPARDDAAALAELERLTKDPYDFGVCAARIAEASILWRRSATALADSLMMSALNEWDGHQRAEREKPRSNVEQDIAEIRTLVFRPDGGGVLSGWAQNTFSQRPSPTPFVILNPNVSIRAPGAERNQRSVFQSFRDHRVLFMTGEQQGILKDIVLKVGGPSSPDRATEHDLLSRWSKFFPTERMWGGVVTDTYPHVSLETYPIITELEFLNADRTRAAVRVVVGGEGATVVLEKDQGVWTARSLVDRWIS